MANLCGKNGFCLAGNFLSPVTKICKTCVTEKPLPSFSKSKTGIFGVDNDCKACNRIKCQEYHRLNRIAILARKKKTAPAYQKKNRDKINARSLKYIATRRKSDVNFRILVNHRCRIWSALDGRDKSQRTAELIGGVQNLRTHLEALLRPGWSWENYGVLWEIDHIKPLSKFDLSDPEQQKIAFHFSNTQPLLILDNRSKGNR